MRFLLLFFVGFLGPAYGYSWTYPSYNADPVNFTLRFECEADWGDRCQVRRALILPPGYQYCRHTVRVFSENTGGKHTVRAIPQGLLVHQHAKGGHIFDQTRGWSRINISITGVPAYLTQWQKQHLSCLTPTTFGIPHGYQVQRLQ